MFFCHIWWRLWLHRTWSNIRVSIYGWTLKWKFWDGYKIDEQQTAQWFLLRSNHYWLNKSNEYTSARGAYLHRKVWLNFKPFVAVVSICLLSLACERSREVRYRFSRSARRLSFVRLYPFTIRPSSVASPRLAALSMRRRTVCVKEKSECRLAFY